MIASKHRILLLSMILGVCVPVRGQERITCALLADRDPAMQSSALVPLLEARLSQDEQIQLLERTEIERIFAEQQLSAAGLEQRDSVIKMGRLLRANAFILLSLENTTPAGGAGDEGQLRGRAAPGLPGMPSEFREPEAAGAGSKSPTGRLVRVRVAETAHGLRLWEGYESLEAANVEALASRIVQKVRPALHKIAQLDGQAVPVGIVDIHRVQLPEKYEYLARALPGLLSARLGKERRIIMLERESLGVLLREKQLTEGPDAAFWNSAVLIDGYLQPSQSSGIEMTLRLRGAAEKEIAALHRAVDPNNTLAAVDAASTEIIKSVLHASSSATWDSANEADEFYRQGQLMAAHLRRDAARPLLEAARALQPRNVQYTDALLRNELSPSPKTSGLITKSDQPDDSSYSPLALAELIAVLARQIRDGYNEGSLTANNVVAYASVLMPTVGRRDYFSSPASWATEQVRLINRQSRLIWVDTCERALREEESPYPNPFSVESRRIDLAWIRSDEPPQRMEDVKAAINRVILPPALGGKFESVDQRCYFCDQMLFMREIGFVNISGAQPGISGQDDGFSELWNDYVAELAEVADPLVRLYALMTQVQGVRLSSDNADEMGELSARAVSVLPEVIREFGGSISDEHKRRIYKNLGMCLAAVPPNAALDLWAKAWTPFIEARDARNLALFFPHKAPAGSGENRHIRLLQQVADVLRADRSNRSSANALTLVEDFLARVQPPPEQVTRRTEAETPSVRRSPGLDSPFMYGLMHAEIRGSLLLVARLYEFNSQRRDLLDVIAVDLRDLRLISVQTIHCPTEGRLPGWVSIGDIAIIADTAHVGTHGKGIARVGAIRKEGRRLADDYECLDEKCGLPSAVITGLVEQGTQLWVAFGRQGSESGLGLYDPATRRWQGILCSTRPGEPPFNGGSPYSIESLTMLPPNRLFFYARLWMRSPAQRDESYNGLWELDTVSHKLTYSQTLSPREIVPMGERLLLKDRGHIMEFDPVAKQVVLTLGYFPWGDSLQDWLGRPVTTLEFKKVPFMSDSLVKELGAGTGVSGLNILSGDIHKDKLWARLGLAQMVVIPRGATTKDQIRVRENDLLDGQQVCQFLSTPYGLIGLGETVVGLIDPDTEKVVKLIDTTAVLPDRYDNPRYNGRTRR